MTAATARSASTAQHAVAHPVPCVIRVRGVMDLDHSAELSDALRTGIELAHKERRTDPDLVVDLTHSSFCDSSGLGVLLQARSAAADQGLTVRLAAPSHQMLRLLELTGITEVFPLLPACPAAATVVAGRVVPATIGPSR
ncbi:STAS domain-containing protein [Streptomyces sp. NPDC059566]|uniref:STAS domain-containing protein n=1 Tax=Streptomyces sp. NPDC059566 TaxID=3346866 RepID=UPI0036A9C264